MVWLFLAGTQGHESMIEMVVLLQSMSIFFFEQLY